MFEQKRESAKNPVTEKLRLRDFIWFLERGGTFKCRFQ